MAERRRESFVVGRWLAKLALRELTGVEDLRRIQVGWGVFGQPVVKTGSGGLGVTISHCDTSGAALAYPEEQPMGVDLEAIESVKEAQIASHLSPAEKRLWLRVSLDERIGETIIWTAKEAISKVLRCGFTAPMEVLEVNSLLELGGSQYELRYTNFSQYRCCALAGPHAVLSIALPARTQIDGLEAAWDRIF